MAVDIKQLMIGAHVEVNGVRRAVFGLGCGRVSYLPHPTSSVALSVFAAEVNPIPITHELLVELGFEKVEEWGHYSVFLKDDIEVGIVRERVYVKHKQGVLRDVKNLHNLEAFIFLTLGKELIEE